MIYAELIVGEDGQMVDGEVLISGLPIWVIYDFPDCFVARLFYGVEPTSEEMQAGDLEALRGELRARGLACIARHPDDHPTVVETWL